MAKKNLKGDPLQLFAEKKTLFNIKETQKVG